MLSKQFLLKLAGIIVGGVLLYFIFLLVLITLQYIPINTDVAFLRIKQDEMSFLHYRIAFFTHVYSSIFVIIIGFLQFSKSLRNRFPKVHRSLGKIYVFLILFIAGPSGFIIAIEANGGIIAQVSFVLLSILWIVFTYLAYRFARLRNFEKHRNFMLRSYTLTLSAISLRLFKWGIAKGFQLPPMDTYQIVSILGWTVNLFAVEIYIRWGRQTKVV